MADSDDDFEKYLEVYDIVDADVAEARTGYREAEFEDMDNLKVLRILSNRLTVLRRITLCSLMAIPADGNSRDSERWRTAAEVMQKLASVTGEASERINEIFAKEDGMFYNFLAGIKLHRIGLSLINVSRNCPAAIFKPHRDQQPGTSPIACAETRFALPRDEGLTS